MTCTCRTKRAGKRETLGFVPFVPFVLVMEVKQQLAPCIRDGVDCTQALAALAELQLLAPFQLEGVRWLLDHPDGCILADEVGLGKS